MIVARIVQVSRLPVVCGVRLWCVALILVGAATMAQERLVPPPHLEDLAKAHHCVQVLGFVADEESNQAAPFDLHYEFKYQPPKTLLAGWCTKDAGKPNGPWTLLIWAEREGHPLRSCPDEIANVKRIGRPAIETWAMIPHDFVMMDTGERPGVKDIRMMFGVQNHLPGGIDYYACMAGRWARYAPERK
jgi:hypothetical protein